MPRTGLSALEIKNKAVEATMVKMRQVGFDKVRLTDVAKKLGVSHAALYAHFEDKSALFDAVSERWLLQIDDSLAAVCRRRSKDPSEKIIAWMLTLHRAKLAKIQHDPELYKSFDLSSSMEKAYVRRHLETMRAQLVDLAKEAIAKRRLRDADPEAIALVLHESMIAFHHPKLVAQHSHEKREPLLRAVLDNVLKGLDLKAR
jgi:AcrR family transcriptional regulator